MAKEKSEKINFYLVTIVGIVAVVGIFVLILHSGQSINASSTDVSGQAINPDFLRNNLFGSSCRDTDGGNESTIYGELTYGTTTLVDECSDETHLIERMCNFRSRSPRYSQEIECGSPTHPTQCSAGVCI